jgi:hypothetical protein
MEAWRTAAKYNNRGDRGPPFKVRLGRRARRTGQARPSSTQLQVQGLVASATQDIARTDAREMSCHG